MAMTDLGGVVSKSDEGKLEMTSSSSSSYPCMDMIIQDP